MSARGNLVPVLVVVAAIIVLWYLGAVWLNADWAYDQAGRTGVELGFGDLVRETWSQERPLLPAPHQVVAELWRTTVEVAPTSRRSLLRHAGITLSATRGSTGFVTVATRLRMTPIGRIARQKAPRTPTTAARRPPHLETPCWSRRV